MKKDDYGMFGKKRRKFQSCSNPIKCLAYDPKTQKIWFSSSSTIIIESTTTKSQYKITPQTKKLRGHKKRILSIVIHNKLKRVFSGSEDKTIKVWDLQKEEYIRGFKAHDGFVTALLLFRED